MECIKKLMVLAHFACSHARCVKIILSVLHVLRDFSYQEAHALLALTIVPLAIVPLTVRLVLQAFTILQGMFAKRVLKLTHFANSAILQLVNHVNRGIS